MTRFELTKFELTRLRSSKLWVTVFHTYCTDELMNEDSNFESWDKITITSNFANSNLVSRPNSWTALIVIYLQVTCNARQRRRRLFKMKLLFWLDISRGDGKKLRYGANKTFCSSFRKIKWKKVCWEKKLMSHLFLHLYCVFQWRVEGSSFLTNCLKVRRELQLKDFFMMT